MTLFEGLDMYNVKRNYKTDFFISKLAIRLI